MCTKKYIYIYNALQKVTNTTRPICGSHSCMEYSHLANISDWKLKPDMALRERFEWLSGKRLVYSFYFFFHF